MKVDLNGADGSNLSEIRSPKTGQGMAPAASATDLGQPAVEDRTTLTTDAATVQALTAKAMTSSEVRDDKVQALQQAIANGEYKIDPEKIAEGMIRDSE